MNRYTVMPLNLKYLDEICEDISEQYKSGAADMALFMIKLVPEGTPLIPKAEQQAEVYAIFRDRLLSMGLKCGILVQCTIGHGYKLSARPPFQMYENLTDGEWDWTVCPYDEGFREHMKHSFAVLAKEGPEVIMVDDDFRLIQRGGLGCACPLHMKEIERLNGAPLSRERILSAVKGNSENGKHITEMFVKTQIDSLVGAARAMREGIDSVDKAIPGIYCTCGISAEGAAEIARILAGEGNPSVIRVNNGNYTALGARLLTTAFQRAAIEKTVIDSQGGADILLAETDTCPQNRYSTGAMSLHAHYTGTILEGIFGAKHWITKLSDYQKKSGIAYRRVLAKYNGFYSELSKTVPSLKWEGCRAPLSTVPDYCFTESSAINSWVSCVLERLGLPIYYSAEQGGAVFLERDGTENFTDEELLGMLSGTVVLDGYAAKNICDRGLGEYIGASVREWKGPAPSVELIGGEKKRVAKQTGALEIVPLTGAVAESVICNIPDGVTDVPLFPGSISFDNSLGGRVITFAGSAKTAFIYTEAFSFLDEFRKEQLVKLLSESGNLPVYYPDDAEVYLKTAICEDGSRLVAFFNIGLDPIEEITLVSKEKVYEIKRLTPSGERERVDFTSVGDALTLKLPAYTLTPEILFLY